MPGSWAASGAGDRLSAREQAELGAHCVEAMSSRVDGHGPRSALGRHRLDDRYLSGVSSCTTVMLPSPFEVNASWCCRVESAGVDAGADGGGGDDLARFGVYDGHDLVAAAGEESLVHAIDRQTGWIFTGSQRPVRIDGERLWIEDDDLALVFDVDVDTTAIDDTGLGLTAEVDGANDVSVGRIDHRGVGGPAVEGEQALRSWIV